MPEDVDCRRLLHNHPDLAAVHQALASLGADRNADAAQALRRCTDELRTFRVQTPMQVDPASHHYSASFGRDAWSLEELRAFRPQASNDHLISGKLRFQGATPIIDLLKDDVRRLSHLFETKGVLQPTPLPHHRAVWVEAKFWDDASGKDGDVSVERSVHHLVIKPHEYARVHLDKAWSLKAGIERHEHLAMRISLLESLNDEDLSKGVPAVLDRPKTAGERLLLPRWMQYVPAAFIEEPGRGEAHLRRRRLNRAKLVLLFCNGPLNNTTWLIDEQRNELHEQRNELQAQVLDGRRRLAMHNARREQSIEATLCLVDVPKIV